MPDSQEEVLAETLYDLFWQAIGSAHFEWLELQPNERTAWVILAEFIIASRDDNIPDHK